MGNRAVLTSFKGSEALYGGVISNDYLGIYLHWNGGRDSVEAFLKYCELQDIPSIEKGDYALARMCQVIGNFFGGTLSIGIDKLNKLDYDNGDNGVYVIENNTIIGRRFFEEIDGEQQEYDLKDMLYSIDLKQPSSYQFGEDIKKIELLDWHEIELGDYVYLESRGFDKRWEKYEVVGFKEEPIGPSGSLVCKYPVINKYEGNNVNNILGKYGNEKYKVIKINN